MVGQADISILDAWIQQAMNQAYLMGTCMLVIGKKMGDISPEEDEENKIKLERVLNGLQIESVCEICGAQIGYPNGYEGHTDECEFTEFRHRIDMLYASICNVAMQAAAMNQMNQNDTLSN